ncbi:MAG: hypothetical protein KF746_24865 [Chitinophagaceae bacterium]|nr:hypothetical protein [Chitinophagaceae bacterium]
MAFGDRKLIRVSTFEKYKLKVDVYSLTAYKDSLVYHKTYNDSNENGKIKELFKKYDILNIASLNYDFISRNDLPRVNDGNMYEIEVKVDNNFTYKEFDNPEVYAKHFANKAKQAATFTSFIRDLEKMLNVKISEPEF